MGFYFDDELSMAHRAGKGVETTLSVIAHRYTTQNPRAPLTFRAYTARGIERRSDYRYHANFDEIFPEAQDEECTHAWARMWSPKAASLMFDVNCRGPLWLFLNGTEAWRSDIFSERYPDRRHRLTLSLQKGWNQFVIRAKKTRGGFGWSFGSWLGKHPYIFMMPSRERDGQEGWLYSKPALLESPAPPSFDESEEKSGYPWAPSLFWPPEDLRRGVFERIFGTARGASAVAWTQVKNATSAPLETTLRGTHVGATRILLDGKAVFAADGSGDFTGPLHLSPGTHHLMVVTQHSDAGWTFDLTLETPGGPLPFHCPCDLRGSGAPWLFSGPYEEASLPSPEALQDFFRIHETLRGPGYWRLDHPATHLRIYNENPLYGRWNYPLGVTIYGLLHAARTIGSDELQAYVRDHVQVCCTTYPYSLWDRSQFGGPTHVHRLLSSIDSLDDCGSFGSCLLEVAKYCELEGFEPIAHFVADFIAHTQDRFPDGAFYRREMMHAFHENTMWADDLYMSVPFLCRYYALTGEDRYIDDAANQFIGFRQRLYLPAQRLMSHVYDLRREMATGVPWGRANGWTVFSLSELLAALPPDHDKRPELLAFFRELCAGILELQDDAGMWHQVLTHLDSYPETSCTAMFIYAFSRGVQHDWLEDHETYANAIFKAWEALNRISIDRDGNVYGVCRGSEFSFTPDYYKYDLSWNLNDTHGTGIVLLAGVEVNKLMQHLAAPSTLETEKR